MRLPGRSRQEHAFELGDHLGESVDALESLLAQRPCSLQVDQEACERARAHRLHGAARFRQRQRAQTPEHARLDPGARPPVPVFPEAALHEAPCRGEAGEAVPGDGDPDAEARRRGLGGEGAVRARVACEQFVQGVERILAAIAFGRRRTGSFDFALRASLGIT